MPVEVVSSNGRSQLGQRIEQLIRTSKPSVIGIVSAFVTNSGLDMFLEIVKRSHIKECRLVAGTIFALTHPQALSRAGEAGWLVKLGTNPGGVFHPKLIVGGDAFDSNGSVRNSSVTYIGSANLTRGAFTSNAECGVLGHGDTDVPNSSMAFADYWNQGIVADTQAIDEYAKKFVIQNRQRTRDDLNILGVSDSRQSSMPPNIDTRQPQPKNPAVTVNYATVVWIGLASYTGERAFQVEYPLRVGAAVNHLLGKTTTKRTFVDVLCSDGKIRHMMAGFYLNNSMYRLNVPNDEPGVDAARANKSGIAVVQSNLDGNAPVQFEIIPPGKRADEFRDRSSALNTWGRTRTRFYGWF